MPFSKKSIISCKKMHSIKNEHHRDQWQNDCHETKPDRKKHIFLANPVVKKTKYGQQNAGRLDCQITKLGRSS